MTLYVDNKELSDAHLQKLINKIIIFKDEEEKLSLYIVLNTPFKYHEDLAGYFTDGTSSFLFNNLRGDTHDKIHYPHRYGCLLRICRTKRQS